MDLELPDRNGIDATREVRSACPDVRVLVLTMHADETAVLAALRAGANGYILKGAHQDDIVRAILGAAAGELILGPDVAGVVTGRVDALGPSRTPFAGLTDREHDVLDLLADGQPNGRIATTLGISRKTVANHIANILAKLPAADRAEAIAKARAAGYGEDPGR
jgi:DNA-binding NarL/FixJ family response regulator